MTENDLRSFIKVITDYFSDVTGEASVMGIPYIKGEKDNAYDYTGVIGISGTKKGGIYFTANEGLLKEFGKNILGDVLFNEESLLDLIGEMVNTISGNMREIFGSSFHISVPIVMKGLIDEIVMKLKPPVYIIPMTWKGFECHLAIGLE